MSLTFEILRGPEFDFGVRYKYKVITGYQREVFQRVSYICDIYGYNESRL